MGAGLGSRSSSPARNEHIVAHRHPLPPKAPMPGEWGSKLHRRRMKQSLKSVEWSSLPLGTSSSGGSDSNSSSCQLTNPYTVQRVTGHPPSPPSLTSSEKTEVPAGSLSKDAQAEPEGGVGQVSLGRHSLSSLRGYNFCPEH